MGVERVDYSSDEEFQQAFADEQQQYNDWVNAQWEPKIVPCYFCGEQAYEGNGEPADDVCDFCATLSQVEKLILLHKRKGEKK